MNKYDWQVQEGYTQKEIINKIGEITKSLCEKFEGLSASINGDVMRYKEISLIHPSLRSIEINFIYNPNPYNHKSYVCNVFPYNIVDLDMFEKDFREEVIKEIINGKDKFERIYRSDINE